MPGKQDGPPLAKASPAFLPLARLALPARGLRFGKAGPYMPARLAGLAVDGGAVFAESCEIQLIKVGIYYRIKRKRREWDVR